MYDDPTEEINALNAELAMTRASRDEARADADRIAANLDRANAFLLSAVTERDALKARLAALPDMADPRDPPVESAEGEEIERLWGTLFTLGGGLNRSDFADGIEGIADAVSAALSYGLGQIRGLADERDHATRLAMEQFRHRLYRT